CGRRFASLGPNRALPFGRLSASTGSLHVAPLRWVHDDAQSYQILAFAPWQMSALGQKRTFAVQNLMSALPPIATAKADFRKSSCLLYPRKRTCAVQLGMSALGQKRT